MGHLEKEKGRAFERWVAQILNRIPGIEVQKANICSETGEIDILIRNFRKEGIWPDLGTFIVGECKNLKDKVSIGEIAVFASKMQSFGPFIKTGFMFAANGVSRRAMKKIREERLLGRNIIVLNHSDLEAIKRGEVDSIVEERFLITLCL